VTQRILGLLACASLVFASGCATTGGVGYPPADDGARTARPLSLPAGLEPAASEPAGAVDSEAEDSPEQTRLGSGSFINRDLASRGVPGAGATGEVTFNFEGESLHAVVKAILGDFLQENYVIAPGVQGTVTFSTAKPLRGDQALSILEMLLRWNNATAVWQDGRYTILPVAQALPGNLTPRTGPASNARGYEVRAVPLQYISAVEMEKLIKPYAKPEGIVSVDPARNMLVLAGTAAELANYQRTIEIFDVDWLAGMSVGTFRLEQAEAGKVVTELEKVFGEGSGTPLAGMFRFISLEGVNSIIVITPQPRYLGQVEEWIERLDAGGSQSGSRLYVYDVKNVKATDLAGTLGEIFGGQPRQSASSTGGAVAPGLEPVRASTLGRGEQPRFDANAPAEPGSGGGAATAFSGGPEGASGGGGTGAVSGPVVDAAGGIALGSEENVRVSAIEENNQLLVKATSQQWESIRRVIERLDQIPLQVHIEAKIVAVNLNDELQYGVNWFFENSVPSGLQGTTSVRRDWSSIGGAVGGSGISWTFVGPDASAALSLLQGVTNTKVLSAPSLMVLNNKSATINVGDQIPVNSVSIGIPGNNLNTGTSSYTQYLQTGITLSVTPRVNPGGLVFMEIEQEDSQPGAATEGGNRQISTRNISSEVAVQSGQTIILGGLIQQTDARGSNGVPFLSRIPVIGGLFGSQTRTDTRNELLVMITPRVITSGEEARQVTEEYQRQFRGLAPLRVTTDAVPEARP
jgi:general secretion pathway protein D